MCDQPKPASVTAAFPIVGFKAFAVQYSTGFTVRVIHLDWAGARRVAEDLSAAARAHGHDLGVIAHIALDILA